MSTTPDGGPGAVPEIDDLRSRLAGTVVGPGDPTYDEARRVWNGMIDVRPRAIVRAGSSDDVDLVIAAARRAALPLAVRGGGHNIAGHGTVEGGVVLDLGDLREVHVDPGSRLVTVGPGATLVDVDAATAPHGLAVPLGVIGATGIAGLTLGGGVGWLTHSDGLTADHLGAADLVTATGEHLHVDEESHPDLLWGLRGGGGNFGVVTSFTFRARPLPSPVYAGNLVYRRASWPTALRALADWTGSGLPDEMNVIATFLAPPPMLGLGEGTVLIIGFAWTSPDHEAGRAVVERLLAQAPPDVDEIGPVPWTQWQTAMDAVFPKGSRGYWKNLSFSALDDDVVDVLVAHAGEVTWLGTGIDIHHMEGAFGRVPEDATAFPNRSARYWLNIYGFWQDPEDDERLSAFARRLHAAMQPFAEQGEYVNFLGAEDAASADERALRSYGDRTHRRLVELKNRYDPENVFRGNHNIVPTA